MENVLMRKYMILLPVLFSMSCADNSKNNKISTLDFSINESILITTDTMKQQINSDFERLDIEWLEENGEKYPSDEYSTYIYDLRTDSTYIQVNGNNVSGYSSSKYLQGEYFYIFKDYYNNGNIKEKGIRFHSGPFKKGVWYEFDINGKLVKTIDYDQFYKFTFEDVLLFCEKKNILIEKAILKPSTGLHTSINRWFDESLGKYTWTVSWLITPEIKQILTLDGNTGKIIKTEDLEYINI